MHPTIHHELTQARVADLHRRAVRARAARAAVRARRARGRDTRALPGITALARLLLPGPGGQETARRPAAGPGAPGVRA
ncbi:MAG: hypothetical protein J2P35_01220 [Actinobacteria bacterium]|nr:hypothetical protein [Actinomycetota bacterium]MBO0788134.1 hypothetical protein [Actinomycetota bacterium]